MEFCDGAANGDMYGVLAADPTDEGVRVPKLLLPMRFIGGIAAFMGDIVALMG